MRIFFAFLVVMASALLFTLPLTTLIYDFRTDLQEDDFTVDTGLGESTANVTLSKDIYDDDTQTLSLSSNITETPSWTSYNATTRTLALATLSANTTRTLSVDYDVSAMEGSDAIDNIIDQLPLIWLLMIIALPPAALAAIFAGRV